jgi:ribonuclease Z
MPEEWGTQHAVDGMLSFYNWMLETSKGGLDTRSLAVNVHEFDYRKEQVVYQQSGVTIRAWPAIHAIDGSVSFSLEWKGLKIVFGSDTFPNKWFIKHAKNADLVIHECFIAVPDLIAKYRLTPEAALQVGTQIHTAAEAFGKVMSMVKPRHAVAYHFFKDRVGDSPEIEGGRLDASDVLEPIYQEASDALGREFRYPTKD